MQFVTRPRLVLTWRGKEIVNISRAFLDTNGAHQETGVYVDIPAEGSSYFDKYAVPEAGETLEMVIQKSIAYLLSNLNILLPESLVEMFDSSIGAASVLMPYGGKYQLTETQAMVAKLPVLKGKTDTVTMMSYGFDPYLSSWSPYHGAVYAVLIHISKSLPAAVISMNPFLAFQEYFRQDDGGSQTLEPAFCRPAGGV